MRPILCLDWTCMKNFELPTIIQQRGWQHPCTTKPSCTQSSPGCDSRGSWSSVSRGCASSSACSCAARQRNGTPTTTTPPFWRLCFSPTQQSLARSDKERMRSRWNAIWDEDRSRYVASRTDDYSHNFPWNDWSRPLSRTAASRPPGLPTRRCPSSPECTRTCACQPTLTPPDSTPRLLYGRLWRTRLAIWRWYCADIVAPERQSRSNGFASTQPFAHGPGHVDAEGTLKSPARSRLETCNSLETLSCMINVNPCFYCF